MSDAASRSHWPGPAPAVAILELDPVTGPRTVDEVTALGGDAFVLAGSVRERADCAAIVAATVERFGGVDVLVNNAQQVRLGRFERAPTPTCTPRGSRARSRRSG